MKRFLQYFIWTVIIGIVLYVGNRIQLSLEVLSQTTYEIRPFLFFMIFFPIFVGMLLRLPMLIKEMKAEKKWKINWPKLIAIGFPLLYITVSQLLIFTSFGNFLPFSRGVSLLLGSNITVMTGLVFGYILLDSIKEK
ncbi:hypothetical protein [Sutcliffiella halmapala]|uniref:hypothetical protein n=1 Tax=Sutcliffiella halmapala TaxID=79882 RepID=UPI0009951DB3|nr:hypothetical protein [Sutcliffiella halmapala]